MSSEAPRLPRAIAADGDPAWAGTRRLALKVDFAIGTLAEALGALLVLAEVGILFAGVVSRYVFNSPLMWTDELANFLFLWLAMLGAVVAFRRDGHMRLTTFVNSLSPERGRWLGTVGALVIIVFVLEILMPAAQYLQVQQSTMLITLPISDGYRVLAILVGSTLLAIVALLRLLETTGWRGLALAVAVVGAVALGLWLAQPLLIAIGNGSLVLFFVVLVAVCVIIGVPIAFTFGIATFSYLALTTSLPLSIVVNRIDDGISNLLLLAVPMFVFLGLLMEMTGIARVMVNFLAALIGHVKGGLNYVLLGAMYLVSGISGSKAADMAAVAPILFPEMLKRGAHPGELASMLATSSAMSET
ncbi:MAG: TRAP transporter large permease subunit, partial [Stellaceae bacterium]